MDKPLLISVVLPIYNGENTSKLAIDSVLNQTYSNFELIIINDGSTDNTKQIIESYTDERIVVINQENLGLAKSLNKGIKIAKGPYIARMDADDICYPQRFERQIEKFQQNPELSVVGTWVKVRYSDGSTAIKRRPKSHTDILKHIVKINPFSHSSVMIKKSDLINVDLYNEKRDGSKTVLVEDYDLWVKLIKSGSKLANIDEVLMENLIHSNSIMGSRNLYKNLKQKIGTRLIVIKELNLSALNYLTLFPVIFLALLQACGIRIDRIFNLINGR